RVAGVSGARAGRGPEPTRVGDLVPALLRDRQHALDPVVVSVEAPARDRCGPEAPPERPLALEHEARRAQRGGEVDDAPAADAVARNHAHAGAVDEIDDAREGVEAEVLREVLAGEARPALEHDEPRPAGREV